MKKFKVEFAIIADNDISDADVMEFIRYEIGDQSQIPLSNPLCHKEMEPYPGTLSITRIDGAPLPAPGRVVIEKKG